MIQFNHRDFATREEVDEYIRGFNSFPMWPTDGVNGSTKPVSPRSLAATGYYDAEREEQERLDNIGRGD